MSVGWGVGFFLKFLPLAPIGSGNGWLWSTIPG